MQTLLFLTNGLLSFSFLITTACAEPSTTTLTGQQASQVVQAQNSYFSSIMTQSAYKSANAFVLAADDNFGLDFVMSVATATSTDYPAWWTELPKDVQGYFSSVGRAEYSIATAIVQGGAPRQTGALVAAGAAAVGIVGLAAAL